MRIIAGSYRSRTLKAPPGFSTRPTSDRLRETLFNVLAPRIQGATFLDLYAGSGAVGIEALSRGAVHATFVERAPAAIRILRGNLEDLGIKSGFRLYPGSVGAFLRNAVEDRPRPIPYEVVYLDPPYDEEQEYKATLGLIGGAAAVLLAQGGLVIAEHRRKQAFNERYGSLRLMRQLKQGDAILCFYEVHSTALGPPLTNHPD